MRTNPLFPAIASTLLAAGVAVAQEVAVAPDPGPQPPFDLTGLLTADSVQGTEIYSITQGRDASFWDAGEQINFVTTEWESIGRVQDVIIDRNGIVVGVTTDVGGFLGLGRRTVLLTLEDIRLVATDDDDLVVVTRLTQERLEQLDELTGVFGYD
jgi:hypothetical protein